MARREHDVRDVAAVGDENSGLLSAIVPFTVLWFTHTNRVHSDSYSLLYCVVLTNKVGISFLQELSRSPAAAAFASRTRIWPWFRD